MKRQACLIRAKCQFSKMNKKDKNEMLEEAESVYSCVSEQGTNFTIFPVARVVFTKMWNFLLLFFFLKFLF